MERKGRHNGGEERLLASELKEEKVRRSLARARRGRIAEELARGRGGDREYLKGG